MHGFPDIFGNDVFVIVPIDVSGGGNFLPFKRRMSRFEIVRQSSRCLGNDLEASDDRVNRPLIFNKGVRSKRSTKPVAKSM